jgi:FKBP-type peptidyl-prolyl cis-trans isomerase (trigger factor)
LHTSARKGEKEKLKSCLEMAVDIDSPRKLILIEMAQAWLRLADQAERNQQNDVVYETPRRKPGPKPQPDAR